MMNDGEIGYRSARQNDLKLIFAIKKHSLKPYVDQIWGWEEDKQWEIHQKKFDPTRLIIIQYKKETIGFYELREKEEFTWINNIMIRKNFQSKGVGKKVMKRIINGCRVKNKSVKLQVFKVNERAKKFYHDLGFIVIGESQFHFEMEFNLR